jgi:hypothetical protein
LVTTSYLSKEAKTFIDEFPNLEALERKELIGLIKEHLGKEWIMDQ